MKLVVSVFGALFCSWWSINFQFFQSEEDWHVIKWKSSLGMHTISTLSLAVSSLRIVTIFLCKQAYKTWKSKGIKAESYDQNSIVDDAENEKKQDVVSVNEMTLQISKLSSAKKPPSAPENTI
eukprot:1122660_1